MVGLSKSFSSSNEPQIFQIYKHLVAKVPWTSIPISLVSRYFGMNIKIFNLFQFTDVEQWKLGWIFNNKSMLCNFLWVSMTLMYKLKPKSWCFILCLQFPKSLPWLFKKNINGSSLMENPLYMTLWLFKTLIHLQLLQQLLGILSQNGIDHFLIVVFKDILLINATNSMIIHQDTSLNPRQAHLIPKLIKPYQLNPLLL